MRSWYSFEQSLMRLDYTLQSSMQTNAIDMIDIEFWK